MSPETLLERLTDRGIRLTVDGTSLRYAPRSALPRELLNQMQTHKAALIELLNPTTEQTDDSHEPDRLTPAERRRLERINLNELFRDPLPYTPPAREWTEAESELLDWFTGAADRLPRERFKLRPGCVVANPSTFYAKLQTDATAGASGARAKGLIADLDDLRRATA